MAWPTSKNPKTELISLRLPSDEVAEMNAAAKARGLSRSAWLRDAARRVIAADKARAAREKEGHE